jgi:3-oxoacyl-[acyl-carrier-protein] synthase-3
VTPPRSTVLRGTGSALPQRVVPNAAFAESLGTSDEWIRSRTGIRERRFVAPHESSAGLAAAAGRRALAAAGLNAADLDLTVCATVTPDTMTPSNACRVQAALGCRTIPAFDLSAACSGFLYALAVADQFLREGLARHALVIGAEALSRALDFSDRDSCILFGDGAGAVVLSTADEPGAGIHAVRLGADGSRPDLIVVPAAVTARSGEPAVGSIRLQGREVFRLAVQRFSQLIRDAVREADQDGRRIDLLIPHQVNERIVAAALDATGFPADRVFLNLDRYGNTAAASIPIALDEAIRTGRARPGDTVLSVAFGGGLTWGSLVMTIGRQVGVETAQHYDPFAACPRPESSYL